VRADKVVSLWHRMCCQSLVCSATVGCACESRLSQSRSSTPHKPRAPSDVHTKARSAVNNSGRAIKAHARCDFLPLPFLLLLHHRDDTSSTSHFHPAVIIKLPLFWRKSFHQVYQQTTTRQSAIRRPFPRCLLGRRRRTTDMRPHGGTEIRARGPEHHRILTSLLASPGKQTGGQEHHRIGTSSPVSTEMQTGGPDHQSDMIWLAATHAKRGSIPSKVRGDLAACRGGRAVTLLESQTRITPASARRYTD
jgi:hypothetical protein